MPICLRARLVSPWVLRLTRGSSRANSEAASQSKDGI